MAELRNVHQRKLAVMRHLSGLGPDKVYDGVSKRTGTRVRFPYISIQAVSNALRQAAVEEGLDVLVQPQPQAGSILVELVNADDPKDRIVSEWPLVPDDRAWAYSTKYALVRLFLIGDAEEGDEAELADSSSRTLRSAQAAQASAPAQAAQASAESPICPKCGSAAAVRRYASPRDGKVWFCAAGAGGCGHSFAPPADTADTATPEERPLSQLTDQQRARLRALNESLPDLLQLTDQEKVELLREGGFELVERHLLQLHEEVRRQDKLDAEASATTGVIQ